MKLVKEYNQKIYPDSFLKNKKLMALVDTHSDPLKFILAVMTLMSSGKLKLPKIGVASTREVAALWNDYNKKKISPAMIEQYTNVVEASIRGTLGKGVPAGGHGSGRDEKGWVHKSGKIIVWKGMKPYHVQYIAKNLSKFGLKEKEVLDIFEIKYDKMDSPDPKEDAEEHLQKLIDGTIDREPALEYLAMMKGWCRVVLGNYASIGGYDIRTIHQVAKQINKKKDWTKGIKSLELWEYGESNGPIKKGYRVSTNLAGTLDNSYDVGLWADGGSADPQNVGRGRTEIGRKMAMFREFMEQVDIDTMGYMDNMPIPKDKEIKTTSPIFSIDAKDIDIPAPPKNSSKETKDELLALKAMVDEAEFEDYSKYDKEFTKVFYEAAKKYNLNVPLSRLAYIRNEVEGIVHYFKYKFDRPRPEQLAPILGVELKHQATVTGTTPSYPSGHTTQARIMGLYLSSIAPEHKEEFLQIAEIVGVSRNKGGVHWISDHTVGKKLADELFANFVG